MAPGDVNVAPGDVRAGGHGGRGIEGTAQGPGAAEDGAVGGPISEVRWPRIRVFKRKPDLSSP